MCQLSLAKPEKQIRIQSQCAMFLPTTVHVSSSMKENVLERMQYGEISVVAKNDKLIVGYAAKAYDRTGHEMHTYGHISQQMRQLARLLLKCRELNPEVRSVKDIIDPSLFQVVVKAVKAVCGFDERTNTFTTPSLCLKLGHALKKCASIIKGEGLRNQDDSDVRKSDNFIQLCDMEWPDTSTHAIRTLHQRQWNAPRRLPVASDLKTLHRHLSSKSDLCKTALKSCTPDRQKWHDLAKVTLVRNMLFNRRRSGEIERIPLHACKRITNTADEDIIAHLSKWEQELCKKLSRFEIRGERGR